MYSTKYPGWETSAEGKVKSFDGQMAYAYAKRAQVLLCEKWAKSLSDVKIVSCHPGWTSTPGVDAAYGSSQALLQPLRSLWEGSEGIAWLCVSPTDAFESGKFYLDRHVQPTILTKSTVTPDNLVEELFTGLEKVTGLPLEE